MVPSAAGVAPAAAGAASIRIALVHPDTVITRIQARSEQAALTLNVGAIVVAEPGAETPLPIQVGPPDGLPKNSFVRIRGLPPTVALSQGHSIAPGSWAVPFAGLPALRIAVPQTLTGTSEVTVSLVTVDGLVLAEVKSSLVIATASSLTAARSEPRPRSVASIGPASSGLPGERSGQPQPTPPPRTQAQQQALRFVGRGNQYLREGDIVTARLFYERAVDAGLPEGALAMAASYDQAELDRLGVQGLTGDAKEARRWYEQAREMGAPEAEERLRRLGGR